MNKFSEDIARYSDYGVTLITIPSASDSITFALLHRSGRTNRLSRVCSSIRFNMRTVLPSCVSALTKS
jgi:hypothetical protein